MKLSNLGTYCRFYQGTWITDITLNNLHNLPIIDKFCKSLAFYDYFCRFLATFAYVGFPDVGVAMAFLSSTTSDTSTVQAPVSTFLE